MKAILMLLAAAFAAGSALANHRDDIEIEDSVLVPSARVGIDISPRGEGPSVPHTGHGLEIGLTGASGEDSQSRSSTAPPLTFGGQTFGPGTTLHHEFDFRFFEVAYRYRHFFGAGSFGIEALGGLGYAEMEIRTSSPTVSASDTLQSGGLVAGFGIIWKFLPQTSLQSRITIFGSGETEGVTAAARFDLLVAHALARNVSLRGGLTSWGLVSQRDEHDDFDSINSHIRSGFGGLALGLELAF